MPDSFELESLAADGLLAPDIKSHSVEMGRLHNYYARLFSSSMKEKWPQRAYLGLYSGPGRARVQPDGQIIETTAMSVFRLPDPFTKYIFVDSDADVINALRSRVTALPVEYDVTYITSDVAAALPEIELAMPRYSPKQGLLSFCFVDPFAADLDFSLIKALGSRYRMDFLILLMLGRDIRTNFEKYYNDPADGRIAALIDDPNWRADWDGRQEPLDNLISFLLSKFDNAMTRLGYNAAKPEDAHPVRVWGKGVFMYSLVFYSKSKLGQQFWRATRAGVNPQLGFGFQ
jgi:three-Cys-motif partner protein